jgi:hypothetical protein
MMDEEGIMYLAFAMVVLLILLSFAPKMGGGILSILAAIIVVLTAGIVVVLNFADYLLVSIGFSAIGLTFQPAAGYTINRQQNSVIKEVGGIYYATGYITGNLFSYEFKQEMGEEDMQQKITEAPLKWEMAVTNISFPFKYHLLSSGLSVQDIRDELEGKRSYQEYQLSKVLQNSSGKDVAVAEIQRKINVLQRKMDRISGGEKPVGSVMYIETTAIGVSEKAAVDELERQIGALQIALSPMNVDLLRVVGRELYTLFKFSFAMPLTYDETKGYFDRQA